MLQVWSRGADRVRRGILPVTEIKAVLRETAVGTWVMTLDGADPRAALADRGTGVIVVEDGQVLFSGPCEEIGTETAGAVRDVTISGVTDMHVLADRLVYPDPNRGFDQQTTVSHYARKAAAETLIADVINANAGPASPFSVRRTAGLATVVSQGRGSASSINARFTPLLEEVQALATVGGLVVDVIQRTGTDLTVEIRTPTDRSRAVRFMPTTGLGDHSTTARAESVSTVIVGAQGEGTARTVTGRSRPAAQQWAAGARRVEQFLDRRDTADATELAKAIDEALAETAQTASAQFAVTETAATRLGVHYQLGDTVTVALPGGGEIVDRVRSAEITWDGHGRQVQLTVGNHATDESNAPAWVSQVRALQQSMRRLEVR